MRSLSSSSPKSTFPWGHVRISGGRSGDDSEEKARGTFPPSPYWTPEKVEPALQEERAPRNTVALDRFEPSAAALTPMCAESRVRVFWDDARHALCLLELRPVPLGCPPALEKETR
ncbi:hypothetical protein MRX96_005768 [Rhipicephalus microplus]